MKIIFVTPSLELHGGNLCAVKYANYLSGKGHEVKIITTDKPVKIDVDKKIEIIKYRHIRVKYFDFFIWQLCYAKKIIDLIEECNVVIPNHSPLLVPVILAKRWKKLNYKVVLFFQDSFQMIWIGWFIRILFGLSFIKKNIDKVISVSEGQSKELKKYSELNSKVISNGIDEEFKDYKFKKEKQILFVGRKIRAKGYDVFIRAMEIVRKKYPEYNVLVLSPDDGEKRTRTEYAKQIAKCFLYVNTSLAESFGLPALEAMACGTAVVLSDTVGSRVYAKDKINCLIARVNDYRGTADKIIEIIESDNLKNILVNEGLETAKKYRWKESLKMFENELVDLKQNP